MMSSGKQAAGAIGLLLIVLVCTAYIAASFHPRLRFADPTPDEPLEVKRNYPCYHDKIYGGADSLDVLYFGASKTHHAVDASLIETFYTAVTGDEVSVFAFDTPNSNPEIMYFFFRDYLARNPAPEMAFFEITSALPMMPPIHYVHPLFSDLAPPYLYLDMLKPRSIVKNRLFAASETLRLFIRHIDLSLSRLLLPGVRFIVPAGDNCEPSDTPVAAPPDGAAGQFTFEQLLEAEMDRHGQALDPDTADQQAALLETYAGDRRITAFLGRWTEKRRRQFEQSFWRGGPRMKQRSREYYRRIVALGEAHGVEVGFYWLPNVGSPEPGTEALQRMSRRLSAPVYTLPYPHAQVSYHFYKDGAHVKPAMRPAYAIWFASLLDEAGAR